MSLVHTRSLGAHLYCLRYPWQPFPRGPLAELSYFSINLVQIGKVALGGARQLRKSELFRRGILGNPVRWDKFYSHKRHEHFGSPAWDEMAKIV